jgi:peptidoglycan/xylan/chitin deacetylase (PgdA/CDA1 family)
MLNALLFSKTPSILKSVYPDCIWQINTTEKKIYLTFDDGPIVSVTDAVLDELKKWNAKATFFCIGKNIATNPELFRRILNEGHSVGNHSYDHLNGWNTDDAQYFKNIEKCSNIFSELNANTTLFRPPYGKLKPFQYSQLKSKYKIVMWDVLSFDFDVKIHRERVLSNVLEYTQAGSIVVFHDSLKAAGSMLYVLPKVLEHFSGQGFMFEAL